WDIFFGVALIALVLEAMRRSTGWIMPVITICFLLYAFFGPYLPAPWTHKGYEIPRLIGHMYMTLEGIFGVAVDVSSSLIILFTIFGAFLQYSGAGKFYIDFSFSAMGGKPTGAGRTVVLASFLLGGPSGSGVATTVTLGSVAYPMLAKVGYGKNEAGGLLSAGGRGAWNSGLVKALAGGSLGVLNVASTCAGAGIIVGVVTLTGLGLKFSSIVLQYAGGSLLLTAIYTSLIVWIVGLAVPVTASYIICAVIAAPALIALKVPDFAAHMFIFYYAVLSEVSPPTALSPFAAAA